MPKSTLQRRLSVDVPNIQINQNPNTLVDLGEAFSLENLLEQMQVLVWADRLDYAAPLGVLETHLIVEVVFNHLRFQGEPNLILRLRHDMEETQEVHKGDLITRRVLLSVETKRVLRVVNPDVTFAEVLELAY